MAEVEDVDDYGKALSGGDDEGWDVLLEQFDHLVDHQLPNRVQNRKDDNISQYLLVRSQKHKNIDQFEGKSPVG